MHSRRLAIGLIIFITVSGSFLKGALSYTREIIDLGSIGVTYEIKEKDALEEIISRARRINWKEIFDKNHFRRMVERYRPAGLKILPPARKNRVFKVDMTYTLEFDIKDKDGNIIYPKGYTFNPLDYMHYPYTIVVINPNREKELEWFKKSIYYRDPNVMFMVTDGVPYRLMKELKRPVFYATSSVIERLNLKHTPSVAKQKGQYMEVREYAVED